MRIVHIIPGSGGTFYCQNCMRDNELINTLKELGNQVYMVPMYLPLNVGSQEIMGDTPVFYGAINIYLKEKLPFYRHAPVWLEKILDSEMLLQFAARKAGSTRASGLEEMTLSMLDGEQGRQVSELLHMVDFLKKNIKPDIIHLSNALLLGLVRQLKSELGIPVVCSLQDENEWIDPMEEKYQSLVWNKMAERAADVDAFIAASRYYAARAQKQLAIPGEKISVVYGGIDLRSYEKAAHRFDPPVIGYLCRMSEYFGLGLIVDAFIILKKEKHFRDLKLYLMGGYTADDKPFVQKMLNKLAQLGLRDQIIVFESFALKERIEFLKSLSLLSVPVPGGEAFGAYQVEALASAVPIVQPNIGGYPEFIHITGGGVLYEPNDAQHLAAALSELLENRQKIRDLGEQGYQAVRKNFTMQKMAGDILDLYQRVVNINNKTGRKQRVS
jgi:glycosyltransferase involved in cell wall biosynthesis